MKKAMRLLSAVLLLLLLLPKGVPGGAAAVEEQAVSGLFLSETTDTFTDNPVFSAGLATCHGNNQTRICVTDTGIYVSTPLAEKENTDHKASAFDIYTETALWRVNPDRSVTVLFTDSFFGVASGATTNVAADKDGNIWTTAAWEEDNRMHLIAWKWDVRTETVQKFYEKKFLARGTGYTKAGSIMDADYNRLYVVAIGGDYSPGFITWFTLDLETGVWSEAHTKKTGGGCTYHYGFADGRGGFFTICQKAHSIGKGPSDIEGLTLMKAKEKYHSYRWEGNTETWVEPHLIYVPDAMGDEAYDTELFHLSSDVEKGLYPHNDTVRREVFWDTETGYLYHMCSLVDANGIAGTQEIISVFDTNTVNENIEEDGVFPLVSRKSVEFVFGFDEEYRKRIVKDATGQLYLVAVPWDRGCVEIYALDDPADPKLTFLAAEDFRGYMDDVSGTKVNGLAVANGRNNSVQTGDIVHMIGNSWNDGHWFYFTVDLSVVRAGSGR